MGKAWPALDIHVPGCDSQLQDLVVAELVFALLLAVDRRIADSVAALRAHQWNKKEFSKADGVFGKTLGVVGLGRIGREVIVRAHAFGLRTLAWSRSLTAPQAEELGVESCEDVDDVFRRADIVTLQVTHLTGRPLGETRRLPARRERWRRTGFIAAPQDT